METPVLTKSQKGKSLSAKQKKKSSVNIRNVLGVASHNNTCPVTSEDNSPVFRDKLNELFSCQPPVRLKWSALKAVPKELRKNFKQSLQSNLKRPKHLDQLVFGINAVTRAIENATVSLVLLANDVNPQLLIKHVIDGCHVQEIPVLQVPKLREIIKEVLHFPAIAVAFKVPSENDPCHSLKQIFQADIAKCLAMYKKRKNKEHIQVDSDITEPVVQPVKHVCVNSDKTVYLHRNSTQLRAFVPSSSVTVQPKEDLNYIVLDDSDDVIVIDESESNNNYKNLKVKRLKPNPNRKKGKKKRSD